MTTEWWPDILDRDSMNVIRTLIPGTIALLDARFPFAREKLEYLENPNRI